MLAIEIFLKLCFLSIVFALVIVMVVFSYYMIKSIRLDYLIRKKQFEKDKE